MEVGRSLLSNRKRLQVAGFSWLRSTCEAGREMRPVRSKRSKVDLGRSEMRKHKQHRRLYESS